METPTSFNLKKSYKVRQSIWILIGHVLLAEIVFTGFFLLVQVGEVSSESASNLFNYASFMLGVNIVNILVILMLILNWFYRYYIISPQDISENHGVIFKRTKTSDMHSIASVQVLQTFFGRIFKYGNLMLENPLMRGNLWIKNINRPYEHAKIIEKQRLEEISSKGGQKVVPIGNGN